MTKASFILASLLCAAVFAPGEASAAKLSNAQKIEMIRELRQFVHEYESVAGASIEFASLDDSRMKTVLALLSRIEAVASVWADDGDDFDGYYGGWPTRASTVVRGGVRVRLLNRPSRGNPDYDRYIRLMSEKGYPTCSSSELLCNPMLFGPGLCVSIKTRSQQQSAYRNCERAFAKSGRTDEQVVQFLNENRKDIDADFMKAVAESRAICEGKSVVTRTLKTCRKISKRFAALSEALGTKSAPADVKSSQKPGAQASSVEAIREALPEAKKVSLSRESETNVEFPQSDVPPVAPVSDVKPPKRIYTSSDLEKDCDIDSKLSLAKREKIVRKKVSRPGSSETEAPSNASPRAVLLKCSDLKPGERVFNNRYQETPLKKPTGFCLRMQDPDTRESKWIVAPSADEARLVGDLFVSVTNGKIETYLLDDIRDIDPKRRKPLPYDLELQKGASFASLSKQSVFVAYNNATQTTQIFAARDGAVKAVADLGGGVGAVALAPADPKDGFRVAFQLSQGDFGRGKANRQTSDIVVADYSLTKGADGDLSARQTRVARVTAERNPGARNSNPRFNADGSLSFEHSEVAQKNDELVTVSANDIDFKRSIESIVSDPTCKNVPVFEASVALGYLWANLCVKQSPGELFGSKLNAEEASFYALTLDRDKCHEFAKKWNDSSALIMSMSEKLFDPKEGRHLTDEAVKGLTSDRLKAVCDQITK